METTVAEIYPKPLLHFVGRCDCKICAYHRKINSIIADRDVNQLIELVKEMANGADRIVHDLDYCQSVLDGSWPTSVEILTRALAKANGKRVL